MRTCSKNLFISPALIAGLGLILAGRVTAQSFTTLHSFTRSDGANPRAGLTSSGDTLYGTTYSGGDSGWGTVFAIGTDGTGFTNLYFFTTPFYDPTSDSYTNNCGADPFSGLILSSDTLYGTASRA